ncbi:MAG: serine hydrolase [Cytophagaceae bacterium]
MGSKNETNSSLQNRDNFLLNLLSQDTSTVIQKVLADPGKYRLQIVYTTFAREKEALKLVTHSFRTDLNEYFYPASLVKLPIAALSLEQLKKLGITTGRDSLIIRVNDLNSSRPVSSIENHIKNVFVVSHNPTSNNLYDFLGQEKINTRIWDMGYKDVRIIQKFAALDALGHKSSGAVQLFTGDSFINPNSSLPGKTTVIWERDKIVNPFNWENKAGKTKVGKAYIEERKLIRKPKDFSESNYVPLQDIHEMLISLIHPEMVNEKKRFFLEDSDRNLLIKYMSMYPRQAQNNEWSDEKIYCDSFRKYLMFGNTKERIPDNIKIYNKVGQAYGFLSDCAYFYDSQNNISFFLSATIYVNENEVINDGKYEYETIGFPFLERLGKLIYNFEAKK